MGSSTFSGPITSTNGFVGDLTGNVTGNITGTVTGGITGASEVTNLFTITSTSGAKATTFEAEATGALTGAVTDGIVAGFVSDPAYSGAQTVTRHNYVKLEDVAVSGSTVSDACALWFDAAAATHKAVDGATTKTTPGGVDAWIKVNVAGTIHYAPLFLSKTA